MKAKRLSLFPIGLCALLTPTLAAQNKVEPAAVVKRFEVGVQYAFLGKGVCYQTNCNVPPEVALGTTFTWNITPHLALDATSNTLATTSVSTRFNDGSFAGGRGNSTMVGPRLEVRRQHYGLFVYGQVGAETWSNAPNKYVFDSSFMIESFAPGSGPHSFFAVGAGAGAEYSPTPAWHLRVSTGQRTVAYGRAFEGRACPTCAQPPTAWNTGADLSAGVYRAFGPDLQRSRPYLRDQHPHRFFDTANVLLITGALLANVGDAVTTQRFLDRGIPEGNPIERTFVQRGVGGDMALGAIVATAGIGAMYALHRMGHHWIERALPAALLVLGARNTYLNSKID